MDLQPIREGKIWYLNKKIIITDPSNSSRNDAVFPLCFENFYFSQHLAVRRGDVVLDLCTGSGVLALFAAQKAREVYAVDINKRALEFAKFNSKLNDVKNIHFIEEDLFEAVNGISFDLIIANPPFEPASLSSDYPIHSVGGKRGTEVLERILSKINNYVAPGGSFQIICWVPKDKMHIVEEFDEKCYKYYSVDILKRYSPREIISYMQKKLGKGFTFNEYVYLCFVQALVKSS